MEKNRRSIRLQQYNYASPGWYFVTLCTAGRYPFFGFIRDGKMNLSKIGHNAEHCWQQIPVHFPHAEVDAFVVMPDHVHGIIRINHQVKAGQSINRFQYVIPRSIPSIVRGYKIGVTKSSRKEGDSFAWQRNYYEHVIRDARALDNIRKYIRDNPAAWTKKGGLGEGGLT